MIKKNRKERRMGDKKGKKKVIVKLVILIPYGGGVHKSTIFAIPINKRRSDVTLLTVNRSPHGNKKSREQFTMVGEKYVVKLRMRNIAKGASVISYYRNKGVFQGINNPYVSASIRYMTSYSIRIV